MHRSEHFSNTFPEKNLNAVECSFGFLLLCHFINDEAKDESIVAAPECNFSPFLFDDSVH